MKEISVEVERVSDLELNEDPDFQRRSWLAQRIGWGVMCVILAAGMLGFLGGAGPFQETNAEDPKVGIIVEHQRFIRKRTPTNLRIRILPHAAETTEVSISIDRTYLEQFQIEYINPEPAQIEAGASFLTYTFLLASPGQETAYTFNMQPERFGWVSSEIGLEGEPPVTFWQFIYP